MASATKKTELAAPISLPALDIAGGGVEDLQATLSENVGDLLTGASVFDLPRIAVPSGGATQWVVPTEEGEQTCDHLPAVIVAKQYVRTYYRSPFEKSGGGPPDCFSADQVTGIGEPGGACAACPLAEFGSKDGGAGQACAQKANLLLLTEHSAMPFLLSVPPTSLKAIRSYLFSISGRNRPFFSVLTDLSLTRTKNKGGVAYSQLVLRLLRPLSPEETAVAVGFKRALSPLLGTAAASVEAPYDPDAYTEGAECLG